VAGGNDRGALACGVAQQADDEAPSDAVEVSGGLVGEQDARTGSEGAGKRDAALLAA
jgi:hypothetical protein